MRRQKIEERESEPLSMRFWLVVLTAILLLASGCRPSTPAPEASVQAGDAALGSLATRKGLAGRWEGVLTLEGQSRPLAASFREQGGELRGKVDIGGRRGVPIESIVLAGSSVEFDVSTPAGLSTFSGAVTAEVISGTFDMPGSTGTFSLSAVEPADVDRIFTSFMTEQHVPGIAAATVRDGEIAWVGTYGLADVAEHEPVTEQTLFLLASVSKTLTATSLMQLHARGAFELDDDVSQYLSFKVRNPAYPERPITFEQLLRHRSSIRDDPEFYGPLWSVPQGDPDTELGEYLDGYLSASGANYDAESNFYAQPPGSEFHYCNTCYALLGYLAEVISGQPFENYSSAALLTPLGLTEASWFYSGADPDHVAIPYRYDPEAGFVPYGVVGYPDWPAGLLRMSVTELARFLAAFTQFGSLDGKQIFDRSIVELMTPESPAVGYYTWFLSSLESSADLLYSHGGGDLGARTMIAFNPETRAGFVILTNGESELTSLAAELYRAMPTLGWQ